MGKLINRIPVSRLLISSLPGSDLRTRVELLGRPCDVNKRPQILPGKLDIKRHSPSILYLIPPLIWRIAVIIQVPIATFQINIKYEYSLEALLPIRLHPKFRAEVRLSLLVLIQKTQLLYNCEIK